MRMMSVPALRLGLLVTLLSGFMLRCEAGPMGGMSSSTVEVQEVDMYNHTLLGERILAKEVVTRGRWGTPMLPDGKGGYSLIAPINPEFIAQSLIIPPVTDGPVYRPRIPGEGPAPVETVAEPSTPAQIQPSAAASPSPAVSQDATAPLPQ